MSKSSPDPNIESLLTTISSIASLIGSFIIIVSYFLIATLRKLPAFRLIFIISLIDVFYELIGFLNLQLSIRGLNPDCLLWGILAQFSTSLVYSWCFVLGFTIYKFYRNELNHQALIEKFLPRFVLMTLLFAAITATIPIFLDAYGYNGLLCFINEKNITKL